MNKEAIYCELLTLRCRRGDQAAWQELTEHWERRLFYFVRRIVGNEQDAWDVLQQTWIAVYKGIGGIRDGRALPKWLYQTARNLALMKRRSKHPEEIPQVVDEEIPAHGDDESISTVDVERIHQALDQLALAYREVLTLHFLRELSVWEIAEVVGVPPGTVKSCLYYAKRALRKLLEEMSYGK
ncbi:MAG: sigma-70 family RNA polymerase sigma factor [Phycisphaerales bacterium]|nr:sigma-70 family RNA polymerase sigma factor [Phycisphaerales bacterium]